MELLNVTVEPAPAQLIVRVHGEIDIATAGDLERTLDAALQPAEVSRLELDMSGVPFMDCSGIRVLLNAKRRLDKRGGTLTLINRTPQVIRLLSILHLDPSLNPIKVRHQFRRLIDRRPVVGDRPG
jgi:anti-anti-sigma factor